MAKCLTRIPSESANGSRSDSPVVHDILTLRALVTTKEAGIIIGKGGKNVADIRDQSGVKAGVSKVVPGVHERVLSVSGSVEAVAKVCPLILIAHLFLFTHYFTLTTRPTHSSLTSYSPMLLLLLPHTQPPLRAYLPLLPTPQSAFSYLTTSWAQSSGEVVSK